MLIFASTILVKMELLVNVKTAIIIGVNVHQVLLVKTAKVSKIRLEQCRQANGSRITETLT